MQCGPLQCPTCPGGRRKRLGLEPKKKDWRIASMDSMPKRKTKHFEQGRELRKEAKGLR